MIRKGGVVLETGVELRAGWHQVLPCPFCGSADDMQYLDDKVHWPSVQCCNCGARVWGEDRADTLANWNRRPDPEAGPLDGPTPGPPSL